jgi:hypothetical protein
VIGSSSGRTRRYRGAWLLLLLAFAAALFAAAVPGVIEKSQSSSLQQALNAAPPLDRAVLAGQARDAATASPGSPGPTAAILGQTLGSLAEAVPAAAGAEPGLGWDGMGLNALIPESAQGAPARTNLEYRSDETSHMRVLSGTMPDSAADAGGALVFDVAVTQATASRYAAHVGSVIVQGDYGFQITAIVAPTDPDSAFWADDPGLAAPGLTVKPGASYWATAGFIGQNELSALESITSVGALPESIDEVYCVPLDTSSYAVANFNSILGTLTSFDSGSTATELGLQVASGPIAVLTSFGEERTTVDSILALVLVGAVAVGAVTILLCTRLVIGRRSAHFALRRARGQSLLQLAAQVVGGLAAPR